MNLLSMLERLKPHVGVSVNTQAEDPTNNENQMPSDWGTQERTAQLSPVNSQNHER